MTRGEIWRVTLGGARGVQAPRAKSAVIVSADDLNARRHTVVVVPLSTGPTPRPPLSVGTPSAGSSAMAKCDQIRTVDKARLSGPIGRLAEEDLRSIERALAEVLQLRFAESDAVPVRVRGGSAAALRGGAQGAEARGAWFRPDLR